MRQETYNRLMGVGMALVLLISVFVAVQVAAPEYQEMSLSGIGMLVDGANTDQFVVDQTGTGDIVEFRDNGSVVWRLADGGTITHTGDETRTGDYTVSGAITADGAEDAVQLTAQGYTTQTNHTFVVEQSDGTDVFQVDDSGNFTGTAAIVSNLSPSGYIAATGQITVSDYVMIDGDADEIQLHVQGYTTQTNHTVVVEQSDGTDVFTIDDSGNFTGTIATLSGNLVLENEETLDNSTDGLVVLNGQLGYQQYFSDTTASETLTAAQSGVIVVNDGASDNITHTLPSVAVGLCYGFLAADNHLIYVDPAGSEQIFYSGSAAGDYLVCAAQYDYLEICGTVDGWFPVSVIGTWADE